MKTILFVLAVLVQTIFSFSQELPSTIFISKDIELIQLSKNAYIHVSYSTSPRYKRFPSNGMLLVQNNEAYLFDTPMSDSLTVDLIDYIQDSLGNKIIGFVPNHWHSDCMEGLDIVHGYGIPSYANNMTIQFAKDKGLPVPQHGFNDSLSLKLGTIDILCYYPGAAHSLDNIVVWVPSEKILFAGCMIKEIRAGNLGNTADGDLSAYPETLQKVKAKFPEAKIIIPGHGNHGGMELVEHTMELCAKTKK
ncbi:MAG: subclass B1 metallo-beta-lactamase [Bacteroidales bacterium]|nr:subclass B1 metallo-beta-lactamase [Bacteroidales bacterium]